MAGTFPARFDGECTDCGLDFWAGDRIGYDESDQIVCEECWHKAKERANGR